MQPAIQPTVTQRVRTFLAQHGAALRPWSGLDETYTELYALLRRRRDDPAFWGPLQHLLQEIIAGVVDPQRPGRLPAPQAELLASWDLDELVHSLRAALPDASPESTSATKEAGRPGAVQALRRFTGGKLSVSVLGGFLLLGFAAAGCDDTSSDPVAGTGGAAGATSTTTSTTSSSGGAGGAAGQSASGGAGGAGGQAPQPWYEDCDLDSGSVLWSSIDEADLMESQKHTLCQCFASLNSSWHDGLTELFENGSPTQIAAALENMVNCCGPPAHGLDGDYADAEAEFWEGSLCAGVPVYKGVSFPSSEA